MAATFPYLVIQSKGSFSIPGRTSVTFFSDDVLLLQPRKFFKGLIGFEKYVINRVSVCIIQDFVPGKSVDHMRKKRMILLLALFQFLEKECVRFLEAGFDECLVDAPEREDFEKMPQKIGHPVGIRVAGKGQFRQHGETDGGDDPTENLLIEILPMDDQQGCGGKKKEADAVFADLFEGCQSHTVHKTDGEYPPVEDAQDQQGADHHVRDEYGHGLDFSL